MLEANAQAEPAGEAGTASSLLFDETSAHGTVGP